MSTSRKSPYLAPALRACSRFETNSQSVTLLGVLAPLCHLGQRRLLQEPRRERMAQSRRHGTLHNSVLQESFTIIPRTSPESFRAPSRTLHRPSRTDSLTGPSHTDSLTSTSQTLAGYAPPTRCAPSLNQSRNGTKQRLAADPWLGQARLWQYVK